MAPRFHSAALVVLAVLVTICSLHIEHVAATNCPSGTKNCAKDSRCKTNIRSDVNNCGKRKRKCPSYPSAIPTCKNGRCSAHCKRGYADCNRNLARDGCETFVAGEDRRNCGGCGRQCREDQFPYAVAKCTGGRCGILLCYRGQEDCNGKVADGCEENTFSNPKACGSCGYVCPVYPNAEPLCANQVCRSVCKPGFHYCYGSEIDDRGCSRIFFDEDANHCGGCNNVCAVGHRCQQGVCTKIPA